ncbi:DNA polymerase beta superfamily protein, partial [Agromyces humi]|uniref:DNA polymerase beta superfamily protein n=1 Tax=Agromyces humi TaxID=1766800 RepID=UPI00135B7C20
MPSEQRLSADEQAEFPTIIRTVAGSEVHGTGLGDQVSDIDHMAIAVESIDAVMGLDQSPALWTYRTVHGLADASQGLHARSGAGDLDLTIYPLRKWAALAAAGNPSVMVPLFCERKYVLSSSRLGRSLRKNRHRFVTHRLARRHLGYAVRQRARMEGDLAGNVSRPELVSEWGYDVKFAAHYLRLGYQGL